MILPLSSGIYTFAWLEVRDKLSLRVTSTPLFQRLLETGTSSTGAAGARMKACAASELVRQSQCFVYAEFGGSHVRQNVGIPHSGECSDPMI